MTLYERRAWAENPRPAWTATEAAELAAVAPATVRTFKHTGFVKPTLEHDGDTLYWLGDVVALRMAQDLLGVVPRPLLGRCLAEMRKPVDLGGNAGNKVLVDYGDLARVHRRWAFLPACDEAAEMSGDELVVFVPERSVTDAVRSSDTEHLKAVRQGPNVHVVTSDTDVLMGVYWPLPMRVAEIMERVETWRVRVGAERRQMTPVMVGMGRR